MDNLTDNKDRKWRITLTEEQLELMIGALEDWHRFICGQCSMDNATSLLPNKRRIETRENLIRETKRCMFPDMGMDEAYSWNGGHPEKAMSEAAAISYLLYREAQHQLTLTRDPKPWNVYKYPTLTCEEQGPMIKVELIKDE